MESLQANYRDEEDDDDEEENVTTTNNNNQTPSTPISIKSISPNNSDEVSDEDQLSDEDLQQQSLNPISTPSQSIPFPPLKKHKPLSELPNSMSKKPKKKPKSNSVWTKSTSRKGKKKTKSNPLNGVNHHAHKVFDEMSVTISPLPRLHLLPDKSDDSVDMRICLSKVHKAEKVELSEDRMCAGSSKGYRMVRATRGVVKGAWYFEIKIEKLGETGHTRVGWSTEKGDLQAPVGYDGSSFGYRDIDGCKIHKATREMYGECGYVEGDVIGHYISLPEGDLYAPKMPNWVLYKGQKYASPGNGKEDANKVVPGSEISFFKNGVCQGVAFKDINGGCYYPAASMYTLPNQPNCQVKFNFGPDFDFFPNDFGDRPLPTPMFDVPYQVFDGIIENTESTDEKLQQSS